MGSVAAGNQSGEQLSSSEENQGDQQ